MKKYDVAILGGGPGGYVAAIRAAQLGKSAAIIDKDKLGGICLNWGCIPTKALLKNAEVLNYIKNSKDFGITIPSFNVNFNETIKRSRDISKRLSKGIEFLMNKNQIDHIKGTGVFKSDKEIEVINGKDKELVKADKVIIATGARSQVLADMEPDGKRIITSKEAMNLKKIPKRMLVIGAGAIGVEFAYFYNQYGSEIHLIEMMDNILPIEDIDISKEVEKSFIKSGIKIHKKTRVTQIKKLKTKLKVHLEASGQESIVETDIVLSAVGVIGNIEKITKNESLKYFQSRPRDSQIGAWASKQSSKIDSRDVLVDQFASMKKKFENKIFHYQIFGVVIGWYQILLSFGKEEKTDYMIVSFMKEKMMDGVLVDFRPN